MAAPELTDLQDERLRRQWSAQLELAGEATRRLRASLAGDTPGADLATLARRAEAAWAVVAGGHRQGAGAPASEARPFDSPPARLARAAEGMRIAAERFEEQAEERP